MNNLKRYADAYYRRSTEDRYPRLRAWEFLWDHVQSIPTWAQIAETKNIQQSAYQLGFYLANWGMFRGSSALLNVNIRFFEDLVGHMFSDLDADFWDLELASFSDDDSDVIEIFDSGIQHIVEFEKDRISWTDTLLTKILMGVWGQCPARDTYFSQGFSEFLKRKKYGRQRKTSGRYLQYLNQIKAAEGWEMPVYTTLEDNHYPAGKIIDMAFFQYGEEQARKNRRTRSHRVRQV